MTDKLSKQHRSWNMSRIKDRDTKPELLVRRHLHKAGIRYRLHSKFLPGKPDIAIQKYRVAIEVRGCFWHGHKGCEHFRLPKTNTDFWREKIGSNIRRDEKNAFSLTQMGYQLMIVWECELKEANRAEKLAEIEQFIFHAKDTAH